VKYAGIGLGDGAHGRLFVHPGADRDHAGHASGLGACNQIGLFAVKVGEIQVAMAVHQEGKVRFGHGRFRQTAGWLASPISISNTSAEGSRLTDLPARARAESSACAPAQSWAATGSGEMRRRTSVSPLAASGRGAPSRPARAARVRKRSSRVTTRSKGSPSAPAR